METIVETPLEKPIRRPYHHGDLRDALLRAGEAALERGGVQNLSLRELSRELGVSNTAPRRHFADKQALLDVLALQGYERLGALLKASVTNCEPEFDIRITRLARAYVGFAVRHAALLDLMFATKHVASAQDAIGTASENALSIGGRIVAEGQARGEVADGDPRFLAMVLFAALQGLVAISSGGRLQGVPLDHLVADVVARVILGLLPRVQKP